MSLIMLFCIGFSTLLGFTGAWLLHWPTDPIVGLALILFYLAGAIVGLAGALSSSTELGAFLEDDDECGA